MTIRTTYALRATCAAALLALGTSAFAVDFSANIELDNTYRDDVHIPVANRGLTQSGRVELNVSSKAGANMFVAGKAAFLANKAGGVDTDDMWVQLGNASGDVKLGRFEASDLFSLPGDTLVEHAGNVYNAGALRGRKNANQFHAAGTMNLGGGLSVELGLVETKVAGATKGVRPVLAYTNGPVNLRVGFESGKYVTTGNKINGFGATVGYDFGGFKLTGDYASGNRDAAAGANKQSAYALVATVGAANVGLVAGKTDFGAVDEKVTTVYASYTLPLFGIKGASVTPALNWSTAKNFNGGAGTNEAFGARVRINYAF